MGNLLAFLPLGSGISLVELQRRAGQPVVWSGMQNAAPHAVDYTALGQASFTSTAEMASLQAQAWSLTIPHRTRQEWLALSMDALWNEWLSSGSQTFDEWYAANIPAPDISPVQQEREA